MNLAVLGAGAWGTALAVNASARHATAVAYRVMSDPLRALSAYSFASVAAAE